VDVFALGTWHSHEKVLFKAWERQIAEMMVLEMAFLCVLTHFNPWMGRPRNTNVDKFV